MDCPLSPAHAVAIVGPTGSGKSALAMRLACALDGEIISCDSVQVYRGLDIGSGKPSAEDRARVRHHLIDIMDLGSEMNAALFAERASVAIAEVSRGRRLPILEGGTGLYLTALLKGLFEGGEPQLDLRARLQGMARRFGPERLHRLLHAKDRVYARKTDPRDLTRVVRALEVCLATGRPFSDVQRERRPAFSGDTLLIGLSPSRDALRDRVTARVRDMIGKGLVDEVRRALSSLPASAPAPRALASIGYREVVAELAAGPVDTEPDGKLQRAIVTATMQYAKRQMTYFRRQFAVEWFEDAGPAFERIATWVKSR